MSQQDDYPGDTGDPLVRSLDPFTRTHIETPDEVTVDTQPLEQDAHAEANVEDPYIPNDVDPATAKQQAREAASGTTGREVEAEPDSDMDLEGFDKK